MVVGAPRPEDEDGVGITSAPSGPGASSGNLTSGEGTGGNYDEASDDWFDLDKYRQAAGVAYEFSKKKMEDAGDQERRTIGKGADEQRRSARQAQDFRESDEQRDYQQAKRAYTF